MEQLAVGTRVVFIGPQDIRRELEISENAHGTVYTVHDDGTFSVRFDRHAAECNVSAGHLRSECFHLQILAAAKTSGASRAMPTPTVLRLTGIKMNGEEVNIEVAPYSLAFQAILLFAANLNIEPLDTQLLQGDVIIESSRQLADQGVTDGSRLSIIYSRRQLRPGDLKPVDQDGTYLAIDGNWWQHSSDQLSRALLGRGAVSYVCRCRDPRNGTFYLAKVTRADGDERMRTAVQAAVRRALPAIQSLQLNPHQRIIEMFGRYEDDYVDDVQILGFAGVQTLRRRMGPRRTNYVAPPQSLHWLTQVLEGLVHLHLTLNIIWMDVKLEHILLDANDDVKLTDFDLSRCGNSDGTWEAGHPTGTPGYWAPEVLHQEPYTHSADLYSFGVMIWVLLTGGADRFGSPPSWMDRGAGFDRARDDYQLLHTCVRMPATQGARPLPSVEAEDLVLGLTQRLPANRPHHDDIFAHAFMQPP